MSLDISTRSDLYHYINDVLPANLFHTEAYYSKFKQQGQEMGKDAAQIQRFMQVIGQVVFRVSHKPLIDCSGPIGYSNCYSAQSSDSGTSDIPGVLVDAQNRKH